MSQLSFDNYTPAGDVAVIAVCLVMVILLMTSYVSRTRSFRIFMAIIGLLVVAAGVNILYHDILIRSDPGLSTLVYALRILYNALLFDLFFLFALYAVVVSELNHRKARLVAIVSTALFVAILGADIVGTVMGVGFRLSETGEVVGRSNVYMIGYLLFVILLAVLMSQVRHLLYKRVMYGFYGTMAVSAAIRFVQLALNHASLTTMTFVFPAIAMLYVMHSNPYNVTLGAVDRRSMEDMVRSLYARKTPFVFMSLLLPEYDEEGRAFPEDIRAQVRRFSVELFRFRKCVLFQVGNGRLVLLFPMQPNPDYAQRIEIILAAFDEQYRRFRRPYKVVIGNSIEEISRKNEYVSLIESVERGMQENTVCRVGAGEIDRFDRDEYILRELTDIYNKRDLDDPRVLAFCQPVFNLRTGLFDTAEALMRLRLEKTGLVLPNDFISLAEDRGYIHVLTEIILHKTCQAIRKLTEDGFRITRISVNVSVLELKDADFCGDIDGIIARDGVPGDKIAIELTESRNEADFMIMKDKIEQLHREGVQFYLDDFGTGYSNMERIMELPFDIIKFDRSLVIASGTDERSERIVENLANMFRDMDFSVLFEGVEDDGDEARCREMSAAYLQGYKYSRPVPIEELRSFLQKIS